MLTSNSHTPGVSGARLPSHNFPLGLTLRREYRYHLMILTIRQYLPYPDILHPEVRREYQRHLSSTMVHMLIVYRKFPPIDNFSTSILSVLQAPIIIRSMSSNVCSTTHQYCFESFQLSVSTRFLPVRFEHGMFYSLGRASSRNAIAGCFGLANRVEAVGKQETIVPLGIDKNREQREPSEE